VLEPYKNGQIPNKISFELNTSHTSVVRVSVSDMCQTQDMPLKRSVQTS